MTTQPELVLLVRFEAKDGMEERARAEMEAFIPQVIEEEACISINLHQNPDAPHEFMLYEFWSDKAFFMGPHRETPYMKAMVERSSEFMKGSMDMSIWDLTQTYIGAAGKAQD